MCVQRSLDPEDKAWRKPVEEEKRKQTVQNMAWHEYEMQQPEISALWKLWGSRHPGL